MRLGFLLLLLPLSAQAQGPPGPRLIPGPADPGFNATLEAKALQYDRQFHIFNAEPFGISLDAFVPIESDRNLISAFLSQSAQTDFLAFTTAMGTPRDVNDAITQRGEYGDLGMFGGMPAAGEAFRYIALRDGGAPASQVQRARQELLDAIDAFHIYATITGQPGTIARGIRKTNEPGPAPEPIFSSCPSPWNRDENVWRTDQSGQYPNWYFMDNTSKDQMIGYVYALGAFWDAIGADPSIQTSVKTTLSQDARDLAQSLMQQTEVRPGTTLDLVITGAQGCLTRFHDLNPREVPLDSAPSLVLPEGATNQNGFNALAALGIIRTLYHITGDEDLRRFYYDELITARNYPQVIISGAARVRNMFANACVGNNCVVTNFSNVNMAFVSIYGLLRYEGDSTLRGAYQAALQDELWTGPKPHMGLEIQQAFFNLIYAGLKSGAADTAQASSASAQLSQFPDPPYFNPAVTNCDPAELMAGTCIAIDGNTVITLDEVPARGNQPAADQPLPMALRVPNNFEWRSDPRVVNGGGGVRLNPGGDFRGSYWLGRMLSADPAQNLSPIARNPDGSGGPMMMMDAGVVDMGAPSIDMGVGVDVGAMGDAGPLADMGNEPDSGIMLDAGFDAQIGKDLGFIVDAGNQSATDSSIDSGAAINPTPENPGGCGCNSEKSRRPKTPLIAMILIGILLIRRKKF